MKNMCFLWLAAIRLPLVLAVPVETRTLAVAPLVTPAPGLRPTRTYKGRRDIFDDIGDWFHDVTSDVKDEIQSVLSDLGNAPSEVAAGVADFFQNFPDAASISSELGLSSTAQNAVPTQVLNIPGYGYYGYNGWNLRIHGTVYKQPHISESLLDHLTNVFLIGTSVDELPPTQASQARNLTTEIFVLPEANEYVVLSVAPPTTSGTQPHDGGAIAATGGAQTVYFPYETTLMGDFDAFVPLQSNGLLSGANPNVPIQRVDVLAHGTDTGNSSGWLVPNHGFTVISDIDDILRVTKIYKPKEGLLNSFARPFTPWMNMPEIYANWSNSFDNLHFHYLTTTPEQVTRNYMDFIYKNYPGGSFDVRPMNFSDLSETLHIRKFLLEKIFYAFPQRKFILVADTSNFDVMKDYPAMVTEFPNQVQCIFLRNTSATDPDDRFPYDTSGFKNLDPKTYMFFNAPDDLKGLDIANGQCVNASVPQHVTFSWQGLPFGLSKDSPVTSAGHRNPLSLSSLARALAAVWTAWLSRHTHML